MNNFRPDFDRRDKWTQRALFESASVRRAIRRAHAHTGAVLGSSSVIDALGCDCVGELLVTRRFFERQPMAAAKVTEAAVARQDVRVTVVTGSAELELDLFGDGISAFLRRPCANGEQVA